ncbi:MAG: class SAM-dependent methyltransferase [Glaciihabitans sp.]|nr:class SAM-dependent methyltransferase [Glaciihabitans sp.]
MSEVWDKAFWDDRYGQSDQVWSGNPNPILVTEASGLTPGSALDIGSGEGADSIWLARQGWHVTGVDISTVALERAAQRAAAVDETAAARIEWEQHDLTGWAPPASTFDLVSAQFMHLPDNQIEGVFRGLAAAVAPGGTLLIVGHDPVDLEESDHRAHLHGFMYTAEQVWGMLPPGQFTKVVAESRPRPLDGVRHVHDGDGPQVLRHDAVLRAVRRAD